MEGIAFWAVSMFPLNRFSAAICVPKSVSCSLKVAVSNVTSSRPLSFARLLATTAYFSASSSFSAAVCRPSKVFFNATTCFLAGLAPVASPITIPTSNSAFSDSALCAAFWALLRDCANPFLASAKL